MASSEDEIDPERPGGASDGTIMGRAEDGTPFYVMRLLDGETPKIGSHRARFLIINRGDQVAGIYTRALDILHVPGLAKPLTHSILRTRSRSSRRTQAAQMKDAARSL